MLIVESLSDIEIKRYLNLDIVTRCSDKRAGQIIPGLTDNLKGDDWLRKAIPDLVWQAATRDLQCVDVKDLEDGIEIPLTADKTYVYQHGMLRDETSKVQIKLRLFHKDGTPVRLFL